MARLIMEDGPEPGKEFVVGDRAVIGRLPGNDVALPSDENVSRRHARLYRSGNGFEIVDMGSANGTAVNGSKITASYVLRTGDRVRVGGTTLRFLEEAGGPAAEPRATATPGAADAIELRTAPEIAPRPAPSAGAAPAAVSVAFKNETLQFSPYKDARAGSPLSEDISQRSAIFRVIMILVALAVATAIFLGVRSLTRSAVSNAPPAVDGRSNG